MAEKREAPALVLNGKTAKVNLDKPNGWKHIGCTDEKFEQFVARLTSGESMNKICRDPDMPHWFDIWKYMSSDPEAHAKYAQARAAAAQVMAQEAIDDAVKGSGDPARDRLAFEARRWYVSKIAPKWFGDRVEHKIEVGESYIEALRLANERLRVREREARRVIDVDPHTGNEVQKIGNESVMSKGKKRAKSDT